MCVLKIAAQLHFSINHNFDEHLSFNHYQNDGNTLLKLLNKSDHNKEWGFNVLTLNIIITIIND